VTRAAPLPAYALFAAMLASALNFLLGDAGIAVLRKVFGIILLAIAVKLFSTNAKALF
jgi:multiple antibiotic resistance protein